MSGPIVRTGTTPEFWKNWDHVFGNTSKTGTTGKSGKPQLKTAKKAATPKKLGEVVEKLATSMLKAAKKSATPKKAAKKSAKKAAKKKK